jgi:hypothetical protein
MIWAADHESTGPTSLRLFAGAPLAWHQLSERQRAVAGCLAAAVVPRVRLRACGHAHRAPSCGRGSRTPSTPCAPPHTPHRTHPPTAQATTTAAVAVAAVTPTGRSAAALRRQPMRRTRPRQRCRSPATWLLAAGPRAAAAAAVAAVVAVGARRPRPQRSWQATWRRHRSRSRLQHRWRTP